MFVSRKKYDALVKDFSKMHKDFMIVCCKRSDEKKALQEQLTTEKQRVKDLYIELQLLRNK